MAEFYILAYDLGTSGAKACIFDESGRFVAEGYDTYETEYPKEGWAVHDPLKWWEVLKAATKKLISQSGIAPETIKAISFSSHGGALVPVDRDGNVLANRVMVWNDSRCTAEAKYILDSIGAKEHYRRTGRSMDLSISTSAKLLWLKKYEPELYEKTYKFLGAKEYMILRMTGEMGFTDYAEQSSSGAYSNLLCDWDPELVKICQLDLSKQCAPTEPTTVIGTLTQIAAADMGLHPGTPVVLGSWDNYACATGGGIHSGKMVLCLGTAGWFGLNNGKPISIPNCTPNIVHAGKDTFFTSIHSHSACAAYDWIKQTMCGYLAEKDKPFQVAEELAKNISAGADKLFFLPAMFTGNTFYSDNSLCGSLVGLKMFQDNGHIIRAAMEGPVFDLMIGTELLRENGVIPDRCTIIGGGAKSDLWVQIVADMFHMPVMRPKSPQHIGALGAALYAGVGTGLIPDFSAAADIIKTDDVIYPNEENYQKYKRLLPIYRRFYEQLMPVYRELQDITI